MARSRVRTISYSSGSKSGYLNSKKIARAALVLSKRVASVPRAPLATRGFYGQFSWRGRDELKVIDNPSGSGNAPSAGVVVLLNGVGQGTDYTQRIGRKILLKSILFRFSVVPNTATSSSSGDIVRMMLIYDCQTNAATPGITDILNLAAFNAPMNLNNRDRFKVLSDKFITMASAVYTGAALTTGSPSPKQVKVFKKMNMEQIFGGTASSVGSINTGAIFLIVISLNNAASTYLYDSRVRFIDS